MDEFPLSRHAVFRSKNLDEARRWLSRELGARSLEFATADRRLDARLHAVRLPHVAAMSLAYGGDVVCVLGGLQDSFLVQVPLSGSVLVRSGRHEFESTPDRATVTSPPDHMTMTWARGTVAMAYRFDRQFLEAELVDLIGVPIDAPLRFQARMDVTAEPVRSWRDMAMFVACELDTAAGLIDHPTVVAHVERVLMRGLLLSQPHTYTSHLVDEVRDDRPLHVTEAVKRIEDRPASLFTAGSLARDVGVSARSLQDGFRQYLGVSPMRYLRVVRLRRARADLLALDADDPTTVADVAYKWGFTHLGRFAQYYRSRYGEPPSRTLRGP